MCLLLLLPIQLQVWKATVYLTPLLGGYLADAVMGRFWVILVFSIVYFVVGYGGGTAPAAELAAALAAEAGNSSSGGCNSWHCSSSSSTA